MNQIIIIVVVISLHTLKYKSFILKKKIISAVRNSLWKEKDLEFKELINESNNNNCCCNFFTYIETLKYKSFILKEKIISSQL